MVPEFEIGIINGTGDFAIGILSLIPDGKVHLGCDPLHQNSIFLFLISILDHLTVVAINKLIADHFGLVLDTRYPVRDFEG